MKWIKIVPNISEGRNIETIYNILKSFVYDDTYLIDLHCDPSHNRSVITVVCNLDNFQQIAIDFVDKCIKYIDLNKHKGVHPRLGAIDVFPFINFYNFEERIIIDFIYELANRLYEKFNLPTYFYGKLARTKRKLSDLRNLGLKKLSELVKNNIAEYLPDVGNMIHKTAGAICIGIREELIAYNIFLETEDVNIAKRIAGKIREANSGLKGVQALGFFIEHMGKAQVSMNLTNYKVTSIKKVYSVVESLAYQERVGILMSEIVGLVPYDAIKGFKLEEIKLKDFRESQIFEYHLEKLGIF